MHPFGEYISKFLNSLDVIYRLVTLLDQFFFKNSINFKYFKNYFINCNREMQKIINSAKKGDL